MATARSQELRTVAQRVADAFPVEVVGEIVLTGSVSRGVADERSDIEMLVVTREPLELEACFGPARSAGLNEAALGARRTSWRRASSAIASGCPSS